MIILLFLMGIALVMAAALLINHDSTDTDIVGSILFIVGFVTLVFITFQYYPAISKCEKELTREEHCVLIAVPESQIEDK